MPRPRLVQFTAPYVVLPRDNVDTDQIIPARFLTTTTRSGLGAHAFNDWRYRADGTPDPDFVINRPEARGARVLVAGRNFGCGSSREHAVWALSGAGFEAIVSTEFADIFRGNALGNGLLPIQVDAATVSALIEAAQTGTPAVTIDPAAQTMTLPNGHAVGFPIPAFAKHCLLAGLDELEFLLGARDEIEQFESARLLRQRTASSAR
jgi:3-isopropylmalate/(R)-2-methylmalate dehydratase small subunit